MSPGDRAGLVKVALEPGFEIRLGFERDVDVLDCHPHQFLARVPQRRAGLLVDVHDPPARIDHEQGVGGVLHQLPEARLAVAQGFLGQLALGDVLLDGDVVRRDPGGVFDRRDRDRGPVGFPGLAAVEQLPAPFVPGRKLLPERLVNVKWSQPGLEQARGAAEGFIRRVPGGLGETGLMYSISPSRLVMKIVFGLCSTARDSLRS
jgi:hypothetical protein